MLPPPYVPFKTFLAAIEGFERGVPTQIDRSLWPSYSGAIQGQLLGAFRFLNFMDDNQCPTVRLREMAAAREDRRAPLRAALEAHYGTLTALDLGRASPRQFDDAMRQYGLSGATHKKAVSFFLQAASYAGMPLSALLKQKTRAGGAHRRAAGEAPAKAAAPQAAGSRSVRLESGGVVAVSVNADLLALSTKDRDFVFELIDRLRRYEHEKGRNEST